MGLGVLGKLGGELGVAGAQKDAGVVLKVALHEAYLGLAALYGQGGEGYLGGLAEANVLIDVLK